jgi:diguanylate cyclase (GGDEF)-like protein/PAS domain S-box-containing protein
MEMFRFVLRTGSGIKRSHSALAFLFVAFIALVLFILLGQMAASQRDTAHILDINGAQRMRSQRIAYLALAARTGNAPRDWRAELHRTVDDLLTIRAELYSRLDLLPPSTDPLVNTGFGRTARYARAARAIEQNPRDESAFAYIQANRAPLLANFEATVKARSHIIERRNAQLFDVAVIGLVFMLTNIAFLWIRVVAPSERRAAALLIRLNNNEAQMRSLFRENPDAIAMYDADGIILRGNRASRDLLGPPTPNLIGSHFLNHIAPAEAQKALFSFAHALAGERVSFDTLFVGTQGNFIDVQASLFPNVVDGKTVGVIGVAKDIRALRSAEAAYLGQAERITELYRVSAYQNQPWNVQVRETLAVAAQRLGYDWAIAADIVDGKARVVVVFGAAGVEDGDVVVVPKTLLELSEHTSDIWSVEDITALPPSDQRFFRESGCAALVGIPIEIGLSRYGSLILGSTRVRSTVFDAADRDFLRLVSTLVAVGIQRGQHEQKLDTLAFFDALTGLPNRALLAKRMTEALNAASRRNLQFAVHCLDLDGFKAINDLFGHSAGDEALRIAAQRMGACARAMDTVARVGGDEFVILQELDPSGRGASELAERILATLAKPFSFGDREYRIGVSIGISVFPNDGADAVTLLHTADEALMRAKRAGRNQRMFVETPQHA